MSWDQLVRKMARQAQPQPPLSSQVTQLRMLAQRAIPDGDGERSRDEIVDEIVELAGRCSRSDLQYVLRKFREMVPDDAW